ncbi:transcription termination/antitermination protein NusG [Alphaproteobacteria bacterium]|nr:transcription termination/antitermination protein NusG [Alphaproteobacteria bacterium]
MTARWYVVHVYSGSEKKVAEDIEKQIAAKGFSEKIQEVLVPSIDSVETKGNAKSTVERKFFPGYILVKMEMDDAGWHLIRNTAKVAGFLGTKDKPSPIKESEAKLILQQIAEGVAPSASAARYEVGEEVRVIDGPFSTFQGRVEDILKDKGRIKVSVSIFGRPTTIELEYAQVEKV